MEEIESSLISTKKICSKCNIEKDLVFFNKEKRNKDGFRSWCKECTNSNRKRFMKDNPQKRKQYREKFGESFENYRKGYFQKNKEKIYENRKESRKRNIEHYLLKNKEWRDKNKDLLSSYSTKKVIELCDFYVRSILVKEGFKKQDLSLDLIEVRRLIIKTKRLCKTSQI